MCHLSQPVIITRTELTVQSKCCRMHSDGVQFKCLPCSIVDNEANRRAIIYKHLSLIGLTSVDSWECDMTNAHLSGLVTALITALAVSHPVTSIASPPELSQQLDACPACIVHCRPTLMAGPTSNGDMTMTVIVKSNSEFLSSAVYTAIVMSNWIDICHMSSN